MKRLFLFIAIFSILGLTLAGCSGPSSSTGNLLVRVEGPDGAALAGAKVVSNTQPEGQLKVTGITGEDGTVTFSDIKTGEYEFYVSRFDYVQQEFDANITAGHTAETTIILLRGD